MASVDLLIAFFVTTALFAFIPGPAMFYAAAQTLAGGRWSGLMASLGIHLGGYVHVLSAAAGLSVLLHAVPILYMGVKLVGAAYLIWLGISLIRTTQAHRDLSRVQAKAGRRAFVESVTVEVLNPKTAIFFLAFLPQFVDATGPVPVWMQFILLGTIINVVFSVADVICVFAAGAVISRVRNSTRAQRLTQRAGGTILIGLGAHLAFQRT